MKKHFLAACLIFISSYHLFSQDDNPPSSKEMEDALKEMQKSMDDMSPEDKKAMEDMGVKMPDVKKVQKTASGINDAQIKKAVADDKRIVPLKDAARISAAQSLTLSNADMSAYIIKTHQAVLAKLPPAVKSKGAEISLQLSKLKSSEANTAVAYWIDGKATLALYLMGEACKADPTNAVNLNNYASFLSMCGAEQLALPILTNLNKRYPKNSSILNNISQAWLGLGDIPKAEKYADSTIRIYANHPQANMAKCLIEESRGNIPKAIEAARKAIRKAYSNEKENKLSKLGYSLKSDDINWDRPMPQDPIGLAKFNCPDYPLNVEQVKPLETEWKDFRTECQLKIDELKARQAKQEVEYTTQSALRAQKVLEASQKGQYVQLIPGYAAKAMKKLGYLVDGINGNISFVFAQQMEPVSRALKNIAEYQKILEEKQKEIDKKYKDKIGEGKDNPMEALCKDENAIRSEYLSSANGELHGAYKTYLDYARRKTSDLLYYYQYTQWPEQFELAKTIAQISWLTVLKDQGVVFKDKSSWCVPQTKVNKPGKLQNFDDMHCEYISTMNLGVYKITSSCSDLKGEFDFGGVKINVSDNCETGRFSGSAMVGASKSMEGPAGAELEASVAALVEFDNTGITDVGAIAGANANVGGVTVAGEEVTITINSGISNSGKGILEGME